MSEDEREIADPDDDRYTLALKIAEAIKRGETIEISEDEDA